MKKFLAILLGVCMCLSMFAFVGCDKDKVDTKAYNGNYQAATDADLATLGEKFANSTQEFTTVDEAGNVSRVFAGFESYLLANTTVKYGEDSVTEKFDFLGQVSVAQDANGSRTILHGKTNLSVEGKGEKFNDIAGEKAIKASGDAYLYAISSQTEEKAGMLIDGNMHLNDELDFSGKFKYEYEFPRPIAAFVPVEFDEDVIGAEVPDISELFTDENIAMVKQYADIYVDFSAGAKIKLSLKQSVVNDLIASYARMGDDMDLNVTVSKADIYIVLNADGTFHGVKVDLVASASANVPDYTNLTAVTTVPVQVDIEFQFVFNKLMEEVALPDATDYKDITDEINDELDDLDLAGLMGGANAIIGGGFDFDDDDFNFDFDGAYDFDLGLGEDDD